LISKADKFLWSMKEKADALIQDESLKKLISYVRYKVDSINTPYRLSALRSHYIGFSIGSVFILATDPDRGFGLYSNRTGRVEYARHLAAELTDAIDIGISQDHNFAKAPDLALDHCLVRNLYDAETHTQALALAKKMGLNSLSQSLEELKAQIPPADASYEGWAYWSDSLLDTIIKERNIGYVFDCTHSRKQMTCLENYLYANKLIVDCLNCQCNVSKSVREEILDTFLILPGV